MASNISSFLHSICATTLESSLKSSEDHGHSASAAKGAIVNISVTARTRVMRRFRNCRQASCADSHQSLPPSPPPLSPLSLSPLSPDSALSPFPPQEALAPCSPQPDSPA